MARIEQRLEELGIVLAGDLQLLFKLPASTATGNEHSVIYRCNYDGPLVLQKEEIDEVQWISPGDMDRRLALRVPGMTETLYLIWKRYRELFHKAS